MQAARGAKASSCQTGMVSWTSVRIVGMIVIGSPSLVREEGEGSEPLRR